MADEAHTVISRAEARARGLKRYFTGVPCKHGHIAERFVTGSRCIACHNALIGVDRKKHYAAFRRWREKNIEKNRLKCRTYRSAHLSKFRLNASEWKKKNPVRHAAHQRNRKSKLKNSPGTHTGSDIQDIIKMQRGRCAYCRVRLGKYHVDHIVPISKGGGNDRRNLQVLCASCNERKSAIDPIEFMQNQGRLL